MKSITCWSSRARSGSTSSRRRPSGGSVCEPSVAGRTMSSRRRAARKSARGASCAPITFAHCAPALQSYSTTSAARHSRRDASSDASPKSSSDTPKRSAAIWRAVVASCADESKGAHAGGGLAAPPELHSSPERSQTLTHMSRARTRVCSIGRGRCADPADAPVPPAPPRPSSAKSARRERGEVGRTWLSRTSGSPLTSK
mmetsp:Transcript_883/g.2528  ORF Transcript_883/g.2528 Transcript_883/m.2528 type:complete len:200 (-) Transcript_883:2087-2686(-)